jgi:hypothetical protein
MAVGRDLEFAAGQVVNRQVVMQVVPGADHGRAVQLSRDLARVEQVRDLAAGSMPPWPPLAAGRIGKIPDRQLHIVSELAVEFLGSVSGAGS